MKKQTAARWYAVFLAVYTIACGTLLAWQCLSIYCTGNAPANLSANGVYLTPVYSWQDVAVRLRAIAPWLYGYAAAVLLGLILKSRQEKTPVRFSNPLRMEPLRPLKAQKSVRITLLIAAVLFTVLGVRNGGLRDVLIKAVHICTECIGLG